MTLSDTQLFILSAASQRPDHAATLPANLKGTAAKKVIDRLLQQKLLQELHAKDDMPVWRRGDDKRPYALRITKAGFKAIEVEDDADAPDNKAAAGASEVAAKTPAEFLTAECLHMHWATKLRPHHLGDAARIVAVVLLICARNTARMCRVST